MYPFVFDVNNLRVKEVMDEEEGAALLCSEVAL